LLEFLQLFLSKFLYLTFFFINSIFLFFQLIFHIFIFLLTFLNFQQQLFLIFLPHHIFLLHLIQLLLNSPQLIAINFNNFLQIGILIQSIHFVIGHTIQIQLQLLTLILQSLNLHFHIFNFHR